MADHSHEGLNVGITMIAELAYYRAEQRGFDPGHEIKDRLEAEAIVDAQIKRGDAPTM